MSLATLRSKAALVILLGLTGLSFSSIESYGRPHDARIGYKMRNTNDVVMYLTGTTPVKNWQMKAHGLQGQAQFVISGDNKIVNIDALSFTLPVRNLKGEEPGMDRDAYHALKADQYKDITFTLRSATVKVAGDDTYRIQALGNLTVAGVTREVTLTMQSRVSEDGSVSFVGSELLRMSDYNVERPSVLFGVIRAADEMRLTYTLIFSK
jgi:polyisoprenoid-binding protein YceI